MATTTEYYMHEIEQLFDGKLKPALLIEIRLIMASYALASHFDKDVLREAENIAAERGIVT